MKFKGQLNMDRVNALSIEPNAYVLNATKGEVKKNNIATTIFPEPYENANQYYNKSRFAPPPPPPPEPCHNCAHPMFDIKSLLPMLMSGNIGNSNGLINLLKPLISMLGNNKGGIGDISKIFELFKPNTNVKKEDKGNSCTQAESASKFDDMIIIED